MNGWRFAVALIGAFAGGWIWHSWRVAERVERMIDTINALKRAQDHEGCLAIIGRLYAEAEGVNDYVKYLEGRRDRSDLDAGLDQLRDGGS